MTEPVSSLFWLGQLTLHSFGGVTQKAAITLSKPDTGHALAPVSFLSDAHVQSGFYQLPSTVTLLPPNISRQNINLH